MNSLSYSHDFNHILSFSLSSPLMKDSYMCYETHKISNLPLDVKGYMLPPEPKLYHSPIASQILLNYIKIEDTTQTKRGQGWLGLK